MEHRYVWVTTRRIKPGTLEEFERAWRPAIHPAGLRRAFAYWSEDGSEITGVSVWDSQDACEAWRSSDTERERREVMAPFVVAEQEGFYLGGELTIPGG
ncbi:MULTISPECIES: antibiotic biosynthesis monooxygenase [Streptomyces]|uniref:Antibiotic biosynthesis monooxygenase n=1 Tax=Streptomyces solicathayae TaxID=3081768 RepID=A0ABZ0LN26_9ACTN|nr:antibiotic biosynthesis monooxygenase [Streptomyces sp. HUAS YS2]WOX20907.1 antibiotic biosynthesis monooxygenase [Streptomyces sp. HUAS YS2]